MLADAIKVPLVAVGRFDQQPRREFRLLSFRHLAYAEEAILIGLDGTRNVAALKRGGGVA